MYKDSRGEGMPFRDMEAELRVLNGVRCQTGEEFSRVGRSFMGAVCAGLAAAAAADLVEAFTGLVASTPVDTGLAKAGWRLVAGEGELEYLPGAEEAALAAAGPGVIPGQVADQVLSGRVSGFGGGVPAALHVITNVPYVPARNAGWSGQVPGGFVDAFVFDLEARLGVTARRLDTAG